MFAHHTDLDEFFTDTPLAFIPLERLYTHQETHPTSPSPLHAFLYLIGYHDQQGRLPYDYVPAEYLGYLELETLGKALLAYTLNPEHSVLYLDQMFYLLDEQALAESNLAELE
jgi:hypothetical protein